MALKLKRTAVSPQSSQEQYLQTKQKLLSLTPSGKAIGGCNFFHCCSYLICMLVHVLVLPLTIDLQDFWPLLCVSARRYVKHCVYTRGIL